MNDKVRAEFEEWFESTGINRTFSEVLFAPWLAAKEKYEPMWIPIETAPNAHGERVLILKDCGEGSLPSKSVAYRLEGRPEWYFSDASHETIESYGYRVTHWMPLPSAPSTQGGGE